MASDFQIIDLTPKKGASYYKIRIFIDKSKKEIFQTQIFEKDYLYFDKNTRRVTIPFFNSDNCKKIRVTIEGINEAGLMTREEKIIE